MRYIIIIALLMLTNCSQKRDFGKHKNISKGTMRPYNVRGKRYYPTYVNVGDKSRGIASWYGRDFHGKKTSSGEYYNMHFNTAAHKTLPMNTMVKVTNLRNHKSTIVRINDRGPFIKGRIIDCSYRAGKDIGLNISGTAKVKIEVLGFAGHIAPKTRLHKIVKTDIRPQRRVIISNFAIQVGAFKMLKGAKIYQAKFNRLDNNYNTIIKDFRDKDGLYRVWISGFGSEDEAQDFRERYRLYNSFIISN